MGPVLPAHPPTVHQLQICFVDQGGALESVTGALTGQITVRHTAQFLINKGDQLAQRRFITLPPGQ